MKPLQGLAVAMLAAGLTAAPLRAEVTQVSATTMTSSFREEVQATPDEVWKAIVQLPRWWSDQHTWSGKAANMQLELQAGGCWCERWGEGASVMHGQVVLVQPGRVLRLNAALGPLQDQAVNGVFTVVTGAQEGKTLLRITYRVAGAPEAGLEKLAPLVDQVLGQQFRRLVNLVHTGAPG